MYTCVVHNPGVSLTPVSYKLHLEWEYNQTTLNAQERQVALQLFDRCAGRRWAHVGLWSCCLAGCCIRLCRWGLHAARAGSPAHPNL